MDPKYQGDCVCLEHTSCAWHGHGGRPVVELIEEIYRLRKKLAEKEVQDGS